MNNINEPVKITIKRCGFCQYIRYDSHTPRCGMYKHEINHPFEEPLNGCNTFLKAEDETY